MSSNGRRALGGWSNLGVSGLSIGGKALDEVRQEHQRGSAGQEEVTSTMNRHEALGGRQR